MSSNEEPQEQHPDDDRTLGTTNTRELTNKQAMNSRPKETAPNEQDAVLGGSNNNNNTVTNYDDDAHYLEPRGLNEIPKVLNVLHIVGALVQTAEAIFLFAFASNINLKWLLYTNYPVAVDNALASQIGGEGTDNVYFARPESKYLTSFSVPWVTGAIVLLSAIDHIFAIMPGGRQLYEHHLARNKASFRWLEYAVSCSLMNMHISQLVGVTDVHIIILVFVLSISIQYPAYIHEVVNARAREEGFAQYWSPFIFGCIPWVAVWGVIFSYYHQSIATVGEDPPSFVLPTIVAVFVLEGLFPILFVLQWLKVGIFKNYVVGEYGYMILGLIAKSSLAWITLIGAEKYAESFQYEDEDMTDVFFSEP
ncbi:unnamed protein product [Cylindrotheca closterium]|uniref:Uncharacterized protein n=1 Tax=Cylindrotheca closterium TaxID=2856 RepID=A0AAD2G434_9STRA|nr:unnamed protein product [Cylindrotheca closterium]